MANWSGTYTIAAGSTGTITDAGSTYFENSSANFPTTGNDLTNLWVRITSGTGSGQERIITSNTSVRGNISPAWDTVPDGTSQYEVYLELRDQDHIVGNTYLSSGIITELQDSATIYFDGIYNFSLIYSCTVRWNKTSSTSVIFEPNNRSVQGKRGFGNYIEIDDTLTGSLNMSCIKIRDNVYVLLIRPSASLDSGGSIRSIIGENCSGSFYISGPNQNANYYFYGLSSINHRASSWYSNQYAAAYRFEIERVWIDKFDGTIFNLGGTNTPDISIYRDWVLNGTVGLYDNSLYSSRIIKFIGSYFTSRRYSTLLRATNASAVGSFVFNGCIVDSELFMYSATTNSQQYASKFNDWILIDVAKGYEAIYNTATPAAFTSDNDYISGYEGGSPDNVDLTELTTSTHTPPMYAGLTSARTNARSTRNKELVVDNVSVGTPDSDSVDVTYDCKNSHSGTTVDSDSVSAQKVLNVADTADFEVGEKIEIGFGTVREENGIIDSISAGVSITLRDNLTYTHTASQADTVKKQLRHIALPFIRYGTTSGEYDAMTELPDETVWRELYIEFMTTYKGQSYSWKYTGHSVTINNLKPGTTYYAKAFAVNPLGEILEAGSEFSFTTDTVAGYTDPGIANVRSGTSYDYNGSTLTGTLDLPSESNVKIGVTFDGATKTGTYDGSDRYTDPGVANVKLAETYRFNSLTINRTGTLESTDPGESNVLDGVTYKINSVDHEGTLIVSGPTAEQIAAAVWNKLAADHTDAGSFGLLVQNLTTGLNLVGVVENECQGLVGVINDPINLVGIVEEN